MYKNIEKKKVLELKEMVEYQEGQVVSKTLDGKGKFAIGGDIYFLEEGQSIIMPKDIPHSVYGEEKFKMLLVVSF